MVATASATRSVVFSVSGRVLALPADAVRRVLPLPRLDGLPAAPPVVAGLFRHGDRAVPVLRFDILLGFEPAPPALYAPLQLIEREGRTILFNPGSPTERRWNPHFGVGLITVTNERIVPDLILFEDMTHLKNVAV